MYNNLPTTTLDLMIRYCTMAGLEDNGSGDAGCQSPFASRLRHRLVRCRCRRAVIAVGGGT